MHLSRSILSLFKTIACLAFLDGTPFPKRREPIRGFFQLVLDVLDRVSRWLYSDWGHTNLSKDWKELEAMTTCSRVSSVLAQIQINTTYEPPVQINSESE